MRQRKYKRPQPRKLVEPMEWEAEVPVPDGFDASTTLVCKAVDAAHNTQPEHAASVWNLRGLANNCWHRVPVTVAAAE